MADHQPLQPIFFRLLTLLAEDGFTQEQLFYPLKTAVRRIRHKQIKLLTYQTITVMAVSHDATL